MDNALVVVDDEIDTVTELKTLLEMDGYVVFAATTAEDALIHIEKHRPVGVILDLNMPVVDGFELTRRIRDRHGADVPIVALTGWGIPEKHEAAERAGVDYVLVKPLNDDLLRRIFPPVVSSETPGSPDLA